MKVSRGDVVLLDFLFSDSSGSKVRPALVVQSDTSNRRLPTTIVVLITKTVHRAQNEPTQFAIAKDSHEGKTAGLHFDSAVNCINMYTVHERFIRFQIGRLAGSVLPALNAALKAALGIA